MKHFIKPIFSFLTIMVLGLCMVHCSEEDEPIPANNDDLTADQTAIMAIGDSRVDGFRPNFESYRYELWKNLVTAGYTINFIGPFQDEGAYPTFMGKAFDDEHGGIGGDTSDGVLSRLTQTLNSASRPPDVVILGIGGNDLIGGVSVSTVVSNVNKIIDGIQSDNPNATIFLEQISKARSDSPEAAAFDDEFETYAGEVAKIATNQTTGTSLVIAVDMISDIPDSYFADEVHFNETGAKAIADRYFTAFDNQFKD